jgi:ubiquinone/menaquinone biosynthesis C-methylase UbiE
MPKDAATQQTETATGKLFGDLWPAYDDTQFKFSVGLLAKRFIENGFDMDWFKGKKCLDIGCGGGRYSIAMSGFGASHVTGIDVSETGIPDARKRAADMGLTNVEFMVGSVLDLPFPDNSFDCVVFSGVLMITQHPVQALKEIARVMKSGGMFYSLTYATEGVRWPLVEILRPITQAAGLAAIDKAISDAGLSAPKRRTYLDDLFCPVIDFYSWECLKDMLEDSGFSNIDRWKKGRLDHEENMAEYIKDLEGFLALMDSAAKGADAHKELLTEGATFCRAAVEYVKGVQALVEKGQMTEAEAMHITIGQGHHRVVAWKS